MTLVASKWVVTLLYLLFLNLAEKNSKTQITLLLSMIHLPNLKVHFYGEQIGLFFRLLLPNESPFAHKEGLRIEYYLESIQGLRFRALKIMYKFDQWSKMDLLPNLCREALRISVFHNNFYMSKITWIILNIVFKKSKSPLLSNIVPNFWLLCAKD